MGKQTSLPQSYHKSSTMSAGIPTSTSVVESAVINAPLAKVWHLIKLQSLGDWWSIVKKEEHSSIHHYITYSIVSSEPALTFSSVYSTIRVYGITTGSAEGSTFVEWSATFSGDADASAIQDARYKRKEGLSDLAKAVGAK